MTIEDVEHERQRNQRDDNQRIAEDFFIEKLQADFGDYAKDQLDIAVDWGRYAELVTYDDHSGVFSLEA